MKKAIYIFVALFFISISFMNNSKANAQLFDYDEENWGRIFHEIKKINSRLITLEKAITVFPHPQSTGDVIDQINAQNKRLEDTNSIIRSELIPIIQKDLASSHDRLKNLTYQLEDLLRQIEEIKQILPQLQGAVDLNKAETNSKVKKLDSKISDLQAEIKHQVLHKIAQQSKTLDNVKQNQKNLKEGLAQDMEQIMENLKDLRRKANVNINRTDKVLKKIKNIKK